MSLITQKLIFIALSISPSVTARVRYESVAYIQAKDAKIWKMHKLSKPLVADFWIRHKKMFVL